jgi:hypothetical protein
VGAAAEEDSTVLVEECLVVVVDEEGHRRGSRVDFLSNDKMRTRTSILNSQLPSRKNPIRIQIVVGFQTQRSPKSAKQAFTSS